MSESNQGAPSLASPAPPLRTALLVALAIMALHVAAEWGYISLYWGDYGRWLYEVDRVAHGARIYRDVYWAFPPLGMWIVGGIARLIGSDLPQIWTITSAVALAIAGAYAYFVTRLLPARPAVLVTAVGLVVGIVYSQQLSAPLVSGMYSPAVPVALLFLMLQLGVFVRDWERPSLARAATVGVLGGAGFLTKHDVWLACGIVTLAAGLLTVAAPRERMRRAVAAGGSFALVAGTGIAVLAAMYGLSALRDIFTGYGHVAEFSGMNLPDLSMLTVEVATFGIGLFLTALIGRGAGLWRGRTFAITLAAGAVLAVTASVVFLWRSEITAQAMLVHGRPPLASPMEDALSPVGPNQTARLHKAFLVFRIQLLRHLFPLLMPLGVLLVAIARRRSAADTRRWLLLIVLLVVALALRSRRMIAFTEWSSLLLEVPVYVLALTTLWQFAESRTLRAVQLASAALAVFAVTMHYQFGYGVGTRRGAFPVVQTARGKVHIEPGLAKGLAYVRDLARRIDSTGTRPILAFGYSAGFSYLLGRPSVGSMTQGMRLSLYPSPDSAYRVALAERERLILVDNPSYVDGVPSAAFTPFRWQPAMVPNPYQRADRPLFERLAAGCRVVRDSKRKTSLTVYDCAGATGTP